MREIQVSSNPTPATCASDGTGNWNTERGGKWILGNYGNTLYNQHNTPNLAEGDCMNKTQQKGLNAARSDPPGGVLLLNAPFGPEDVWDRLPREAQETVLEKQLQECRVLAAQQIKTE